MIDIDRFNDLNTARVSIFIMIASTVFFFQAQRLLKRTARSQLMVNIEFVKLVLRERDTPPLAAAQSTPSIVARSRFLLTLELAMGEIVGHF